MIYIHKGKFSWSFEMISRHDNYVGSVESFEKPPFREASAPSITIQGIEFTHFFSTGVPIYGNRAGDGVKSLLVSYIQKYFRILQKNPSLLLKDETPSFEWMVDTWLIDVSHDCIPALLRTADHEWYYAAIPSMPKPGKSLIILTKIEESSIVFQDRVVSMSTLAKQRTDALQKEIDEVAQALSDIQSDRTIHGFEPVERKIAPLIRQLG